MLRRHDNRVMAVSVFDSQEDALHKRAEVGALRRKYKYCSQGLTKSNKGVHSAISHSGHISWWVKDNCHPEDDFLSGCFIPEGGEAQDDKHE